MKEVITVQSKHLVSSWVSFAMLMSLCAGCTMPIRQNVTPTCTEAPAGWPATVRPNCFDNLARLGQWNGGTTIVKPKRSPAPLFGSVVPHSIGRRGPVNVYVLTHGWAPGLRANVDRKKGDLLWWSDKANVRGVWESEWAWMPASSTDPELSISGTGTLQQIKAHDPNAVVLAYSWIDDSATPPIRWDDPNPLIDVYRSEAYTNVNGLRLANAITEAVAGNFWTTPGNKLHLIGHSHGSKVVTTAALALTAAGKPVHHLTILDSPESDITRSHNGANLLGFYLPRLPRATFVDNYVSYFGAVYGGSPRLTPIANVVLDPGAIFDSIEVSDQHEYAATWYSGAAAYVNAHGLPELGLDWPPPPLPPPPGLFLTQTWPAVNEAEQWTLTARSTEVLDFSDGDLTVQPVSQSGPVRGNPATGLTFHAASSGAHFEGKFDADVTALYGVGFELTWVNPADGDYLVVSATSVDGLEKDVLLVVDGRSEIVGQHWVSFNTNNDLASVEDTHVYIDYIAANGNTGGVVKIENFRGIIVN